MVSQPSIADLFNPPSTPGKPPNALPAASGSPQPTNIVGWVVIALAAILLFLAWQKLPYGGDGGQRDDQGQKDDDKKQDGGDKLSVPSSYLLFIHERSPLVADQADVLNWAAEFCTANSKYSWRSWDDEDPTEAVVKAKEFAKSKGIDPPCVVVKTQDGSKMIKAAPWPKSKQDIERLVK